MESLSLEDFKMTPQSQVKQLFLILFCVYCLSVWTRFKVTHNPVERQFLDDEVYFLLIQCLLDIFNMLTVNSSGFISISHYDNGNFESIG